MQQSMSINASVHSTKVCKVQPSSSVRPPLPVETPPVRLAATRVMDRRQALAFPCLMAMAASLTGSASPALAVDDFVTTPSGLRVQTLKEGTGAQPKAGDRVSVHWSGYTIGYQGKRIGNSTVKDNPFVFTLGKGQAIPAFEEAILGMKVGGLRRIEISGEKPELSYPRDGKERFVEDAFDTYRYGPQPPDLGGQRALDFVLDNPTLQDFNRTLLFDIKLLSIRQSR